MVMASASTESRMHQYQGIEVRAVACGGEHSLAATEAGELYTWGWGRYGNLGLGRAEDRLIPVKVGIRAMHPIPTPRMRPARLTHCMHCPGASRSIVMCRHCTGCQGGFHVLRGGALGRAQ